jgi:CelD/BcsL family acetyltransferase involved in cellulose biosynthesis
MTLQQISKEREALDEALRPAPTVALEEGGAEIIDSLAEEWRLLCDEGPSNEPFYRPEWIQAYVRAFEPTKKLMVITSRIRGRLKAVLPLIQESALLSGFLATQLRSAANYHSCRFDAARAAGIEGDEAVVAIWNFLKNLSGWDVLQLRDVPESGALEPLFDAAQRDGFPTGRWESMHSPYLPLHQLASDREPWCSSSSAKFRERMRKRTRRLSDRGPLRLQRVETADPRFTQLFYDLEKAGWKGREGTAIACHQNTRAFYDEIAQNAERFKYLALYFLEANGDMVGAQFGLSHRGRYFVLKPAINENYREFGPGHLVINAVVRDCVSRGITEYDFTGPQEEYKATWTPHARPHFTLWVFRAGPYGRLLHATHIQLRARVKSILARHEEGN